MRNVGKALVLTSFSILLQCAPYWALQKDYVKYDFSKSSCVILPFIDGLDVQFVGDIVNEFGKGDTNDLIRQFIFTELPASIKHYSTFDTVYFCKTTSIASFKRQVLKKYQDSIYYTLPQYTNTAECDNRIPDFLLILSDSWVGNPNIVKHSGQECRYKGSYMPIGAVGGQNTLVFTAIATLWDNRTNKMVCARTINATASHIYAPMIDMPIWKEVVAEFASDLVDNTSYKNTEIDD